MQKLLFILLITVFLFFSACEKLDQEVEFYKDGSKKQVIERKEGKRHGKTIRYYKNGQKEFQQEYRVDRKQGKLMQWFEDGKLAGECDYSDNLPHGSITLFYANGKPKLSGSFHKGKKHGLWTRFYESGRKKSEQEYKEGRYHGRWIKWNSNGSVVKNESFSNGFYEKPVIKGDYLGQTPPASVPEVFAPGIVSTDKFEFGCTFSPDKKSFYFSRKVKDFYSDATIFVMKQESGGGRWNAPQVAPFSGKYDDFEPMITPDGKRLFFGSGRPLTGNGKSKETDIWYMDWTKDGWSEPRNAGPTINTSNREYYVSATLDGDIYFCGFGKGASDIYRSKLIDGSYSPREPLGPAINSIAHESHPFIAADGSFLLVDSGPREGGRGERGLFISFRKANGSWSPLKYMGKTINDDNGAGFGMVSPDGKYLFFERDGDIYWVDSNIIHRLK
jgi:antitoxin component YwqK of YwqJK toxin-antitoxin module